MQAIILAAGMGKRLGKYTQNSTKCMVGVNGKTLIERCIETLSKNKINRLIVVTGYKSNTLKDFINKKFNSKNLNGMKIEYIENPVYDKTNNIYSLYLARNEMLKDDTLLLESDLIYKSSVISDILKYKEQNVAIVSPFESWMDGTCTILDKDNNITQMIDKQSFNWNEKHNYFKTVNIYKFSKEFAKEKYIPFLEAYQKSFGKNEYYEQVLKVLSLISETHLKGMVISEKDWHEIDDPEDLAIAENKFASAKLKLELLQKRYGGYWRFPEILDFCYLVNPYFPPENMINELQSNFKPLLTQYPSGAQEQSLLAGKIFSVPKEYITVGNGAAELISSLANFTDGKIGIPFPTFNEYPERFSKNIIEIKTGKNFSYDAKTIINAVKKEKLSFVILINPDNPSGNFILQKDVLTLSKNLLKENCSLIFDESFIDFADKEKRYTLLNEKVLLENPNLIIIKSISKSYGVPGLRLGVLATSNTNLIQKIRKQNSIWNINSFAEYYLQIYEKYKKTYETACDNIAKERTRFITLLKKLPNITSFQSQANFILCKLSKISSTKLALNLLEKYNIFIKDLKGKKHFEDGNYIRLAVRNQDDNDKLIQALAQELK